MLEREFAHGVVRQLFEAALYAAGEAGAPIGQIATQLLRSDEPAGGWAVDALRAGADDAMAVGAPDVAATYLRRALRESLGDDLRAQLLLELGNAEAARHDPASIDHLRQAMAATSSPHGQAGAALLLARVLVYSGEVDGARDVMLATADEAWRFDPKLAKIVEAGLLLTNIYSAPSRDLSDRARRLHARLTAGETPEDRTALAALCWLAAQENRPATEVEAMARQAWSDGALMDEQTTDSPMVATVLYTLTYMDAVSEARAGIEAAIADSVGRGAVAIFASFVSLRALLLLRCGDLPRAEADADAALRAAQEAHVPMLVPYSVAYLVEVMLERGHVAQASAFLAQHNPLAEDAPVDRGTNALRHTIGKLLFSRGDTAGAIGALRACAQGQQALGAVGPLPLQWGADLALALHQAGRDLEAAELAECELERARTCGLPRPVGIAERTLALVGHPADRIGRLETAVATLASSPARLEHARALIDYGAALRRAKRRSASREPLTTGLMLAHRCGASALAERASTELAALGLRPRKLLLTGAESLTPSERRVAEMGAAGMTNKQIAQGLFVTLKTVETQLSSSYRKLDIAGRTELAAALAPPPQAHTTAGAESARD